MIGNYPILQRFFGAVAIGTGVYAAAGLAYHGSALLSTGPVEQHQSHQDALFRDLVFLAISLPGMALLRSARRFSEKAPKLGEDVSQFLLEVELVHVVPIRPVVLNDLQRIQRLEEEYRRLLQSQQNLPNALSKDKEEAFERVHHAFRNWELERDGGDAICETEALLKAARYQMEFSAVLSGLGQSSDAEIQFNAASLHLMVVGNRLERLKRKEL